MSDLNNRIDELTYQPVEDKNYNQSAWQAYLNYMVALEKARLEENEKTIIVDQ